MIDPNSMHTSPMRHSENEVINQEAENKREEEILELSEKIIQNLEQPNLDIQIVIEEIPNPEAINHIILGVDQEVQNILNSTGIESEINNVFLPENTASESEKVKQAIQVIKNKYQNIEDKIVEKQKTLKVEEHVSEFLSVPIEAVLIGVKLGELISEHIPGANLIGLTSSLDLGALGLVGTGFSCFILQQEGKIISTKEEYKKNLIARMEKESNATTIEALNDELKIVENEIKNLKESFKEEIAVVAKKFLIDTFNQSSEIIEFVSSSSHLISTHAEVVAKLVATSSGLSIAGGLVSLGWNTYQVYHRATEFSQITKTLSALKQQLDEVTPDEKYLAYLIQAKMDRLGHVKTSHQMMMTTHILNLSASSLVLTAATKGILIATGVLAAGTVGAVVLGGAGFAGITLLGTAGVIGLGIVAYQKRADIKYAIASTPLATKKIVLKQQLKRIDAAHKNALHQIDEFGLALQENAKKQALLGSIPEDINKALAIRNPQVLHEKMLSEMQTIMNRINDASQSEVILRAQKKVLEQKIQNLEQKGQEIKEEYHSNKLQNQFKRYDILTINVIKKIINEGLSDTSSKLQIKNFLDSHQHPVRKEVSLEDVLDYILDVK